MRCAVCGGDHDEIAHELPEAAVVVAIDRVWSAVRGPAEQREQRMGIAHLWLAQAQVLHRRRGHPS